MNSPGVRSEARLQGSDFLRYNLEPLTSVHLHSSLAGFEPNGSMTYIYMFAVIAILILVIACGKHEMPEKQDLRDSDGDQISNNLEAEGIDKYIADVTPFKVQAELKIQQGIAAIKIHSLLLENNTNLAAFSKDLMVKHPKKLPIDDYFSEFSVLRIQNKFEPIPVTEEETPIKIQFDNMKGQIKNLSLLLSDKKIFLGSWEDTIQLKLKKNHLMAILKGEAFLALSKNIKLNSYAEQTQEESIKEKTYRVFMDNGNEVKIYYVSKELSFKDFLKHLKVDMYKMIEDQNLLSKGIQSDLPEWWVKSFNNSDKVVINADLRSLSEHYFLGFKKSGAAINRKNGYSDKLITIKKELEGKALVKIRPIRFKKLFIESERIEEYG